MRVFVTGGNGFIGSVVVRKLVERGDKVRCLLRETSKTDRIDGLDFERAIGDVRDSASIRKGMEGCDGVIHLASLSSWNDIHSPMMDAVVIGGTANVLDAATALGKIRTVFVSSSIAVSASREPKLHDETSKHSLKLDEYVYAKAKVEAEKLCRRAKDAGLPVVIVNPCEVYGPNDTAFITASNLVDFAKSNPVLVCDGGTSVVYVDDVAAGIIAALDKGTPGERYILGGDNLTVRQLAELTVDILGQRKRVVGLPNRLVSMVAKVGGALHVPLPFNPAVIPYATLYWFMDNEKAKRDLGVKFRSARETLEPTLAWLREAGHVRS